MWNTNNPETPGKYLAILHKAASSNHGPEQWLSVEEWEGKSWNTLGNWYTTVAAWQPLPEPYTEENPGDWIDEIAILMDRNVPLDGEEVFVTIFDWESEKIKVDITTYYDGPGWDCEDDPNLNVEAWKKLPILVK